MPIKANKEIIGGCLMLVFAAGYASAASNLRMTSSLGIGSGMFPMMLAGLLALLGLLLALEGLRAARTAQDRPVQSDADERPPVPWRSVVLITLAPILFAITVVPFGFVPALAAAVFLSAFSSHESRLRGALIVTAVMVAFCVGLFSWGLGLPVQLWGPSMPFLN